MLTAGLDMHGNLVHMSSTTSSRYAASHHSMTDVDHLMDQGPAQHSGDTAPRATEADARDVDMPKYQEKPPNR